MINNKSTKNDCLLALAKFSEKLISFHQPESLFDSIIEGICEIINCNQASLMLFDSQTKTLKLIRSRGFKTHDYRTPRLELTSDVAKWIYDGGEILAPSDQDADKFLIIFDEDERKYFDCELRIPFFTRGEFIGVLNIGKKSTGTDYATRDITLLRILINLATIAIENAFAFSETDSINQIKHIPAFNEKPPNNIKIKSKVEINEIIGQSDAIKKINSLIEKLSHNDATVLITGESGTGKDLVARAIHQRSQRGRRPLVTLNCAALPESLVESELFGHERGAFTGAHTQKLGKFEIADGSTLFLDEIGDMSLHTQAKVLRVLQDKTFHRLGGHKSINVDVRIIVATHKDLTEEIQQGNFREDLYYRINVVQIDIPPLRDRKDDIPLLAEHFFKNYCQYYGKGIHNIEDIALAHLMEYDFPGNIRELQNLIERAVILEQSHQLSLESLPFSSLPSGKFSFQTEDNTLEELEKAYIKKIIEQVDYNKSQAARILGIARKTLREKIQKYDL